MNKTMPGSPSAARRTACVLILLLASFFHTGVFAPTAPAFETSAPDPSGDRIHLDALQMDAFRYAMEQSDPETGLIYETTLRTDPRPVAIGGTGFGIAAIVVAADRGWLDRTEAAERILRMATFLRDRTERKLYHGAFPHWLDAKTGKAIPFGPKDGGADIVETSFLIQGLLLAREYFDGPGVETQLREAATELWEDVDWNHFTNGEEEGLYWHWDPADGFHFGMKVQGYNECLVTYILAMSSPTHPISRKSYDYWLDGEHYEKRNVFGYEIEATPEDGGPLFLTHYSFIGLDPRRIADERVTRGYFLRGVKHTLANRAYCLDYAPKGHGYGPGFWGLTAGLTHEGYRASAPAEDYGVMTPTAALSSLPFTPSQSMAVLRNLRNGMKERVWGGYGPADGISLGHDWVSDQYIAINQLPMVAMAENYRTGLLWDLFMNDPDVRVGLRRAGVHEPALEPGFPEAVAEIREGGRVHEAIRHPDSGRYRIPFWTDAGGEVRFSFRDRSGRTLFEKGVEAVKGGNMLEFSSFPGADEEALLLVMHAGEKDYSLPVDLN